MNFDSMTVLLWKLGFQTYLIGLIAGSLYMTAFVRKSTVAHEHVGIINIVKNSGVAFIISIITILFVSVVIGNELVLESVLATNKIYSISMGIICLINALILFGIFNIKRQSISQFPFNANFLNILKWWIKLITAPIFIWIFMNAVFLSFWIHPSNWSTFCCSFGIFTAIIFSGLNELNYTSEIKTENK